MTSLKIHIDLSPQGEVLNLRYDSYDRNLRENAGIVIGNENTVFSIEDLRYLFGKKTMPLYQSTRDKVPHAIFITADPDAGGPSELAVVSGFMVRHSPDMRYGSVVVLFFYFSTFLLYSLHDTRGQWCLSYVC